MPARKIINTPRVLIINLPNNFHEQKPVRPEIEKTLTIAKSDSSFELTKVVYFKPGHFNCEVFRPSFLEGVEDRWYFHCGIENSGRIVKKGKWPKNYYNAKKTWVEKTNAYILFFDSNI